MWIGGRSGYNELSGGQSRTAIYGSCLKEGEQDDDDDEGAGQKPDGAFVLS